MSIEHFRSIIYQYIDFYSYFDICIHCSMLCNARVVRIFWSSSHCIYDQVLDVLPYQDSMINVNSYLTRFSSRLNRREPQLSVFGLFGLQNNHTLVFPFFVGLSELIHDLLNNTHNCYSYAVSYGSI